MSLDPEGVIRLLMQVAKTCPNNRQTSQGQLNQLEREQLERLGRVDCSACLVAAFLGRSCSKSGELVKPHLHPDLPAEMQ